MFRGTSSIATNAICPTANRMVATSARKWRLRATWRRRRCACTTRTVPRQRATWRRPVAMSAGASTKTTAAYTSCWSGLQGWPETGSLSRTYVHAVCTASGTIAMDVGSNRRHSRSRITTRCTPGHSAPRTPHRTSAGDGRRLGSVHPEVPPTTRRSLLHPWRSRVCRSASACA